MPHMLMGELGSFMRPLRGRVPHMAMGELELGAFISPYPEESAYLSESGFLPLLREGSSPLAMESLISVSDLMFCIR